MINLITAHKHSLNNQTELDASTVCGCFHCQKIFSPNEIVAWAGWGSGGAEGSDAAEVLTAQCPKCGSESVIGDKSGYSITPQFLGEMYEAWFQRTVIYRPSAKK